MPRPDSSPLTGKAGRSPLAPNRLAKADGDRPPEISVPSETAAAALAGGSGSGNHAPGTSSPQMTDQEDTESIVSDYNAAGHIKQQLIMQIVQAATHREKRKSRQD